MFEDDLPTSGDSGIGAIATDTPPAWVDFEPKTDHEPVGALDEHEPGELADGSAPEPVLDPAAAERLALELLALPVWLGGGPLEHLSSAQVLEFLAACDVLEARASAAKRAAAATLEERLGNRVHGRRPKVGVSSLAVEEIALRLGISHQRAGNLVGEGDLLNGPMIAVGQALAAGSIDAVKAGSFARVLCDHAVEIAFAVIETVLPLASEQSHDALVRTLNAEVIRVDPAAAALRYERAMTLRRLEPVRLHADGMASLRLVGPVFDLATIYTYADASARATKATGDQRTMDQLRADVLLAAITHPGDSSQGGQPDGGQPDSGGPGGGQSDSGGPGGGERPWTPLPDAVLEEFSFEELGAYELARRDFEAADSSLLAQVRALVRQARTHQPRQRRRVTSRAQLHATQSTQVTRDPNCGEQLAPRPPVVRASGPASRLTLVLARAHLQPPHLAPPCPADLVRDDLYGDPLDDQLDEHLMPSTDPRFASVVAEPSVVPEPSVELEPTVLGRDVPHLLGFGPLIPALARELLAHPPAHLTITYYDDLEVEHHDWLAKPPERQHDPSAALNRHVQTYYPTCIAPACSVRATSTDTDHTIEYPLGPTHVGNLRPLCRRHHNLKTHHGHRLVHDANGTLTWKTPLGTTRPTQHQRE